MNFRFFISLIIAALPFLYTYSQNNSGNLNPNVYPFKNKIVVCVNSGKILTADEIARVSNLWVKSIDIEVDTVKLVLKGPMAMTRGMNSRLKPAYRAEFRINGEKCRYSKDELPDFEPKSSQYMISDSCFYLTFDLDPKFQTHGEKTWMSVFMILEGRPERGRRYPISLVRYDEGNPIQEWNRSCGDIAAVQLVYMPPCRKVMDENILPTQKKGQRVILNSVEIKEGFIEVEEFSESRKSASAMMKMKAEFELVVRGGEADGLSQELSIKSGSIMLSQIQKTDLMPLIFEIDYGWQYRYLPLTGCQ